jgi:hypothetical protein
MSNVNAGDLAYIAHPDELGKLVNVLRRAPAERFLLPCGRPNVGAGAAPSWVCESLGSPFRARIEGGGQRTRITQYGVIADKWLRPLRGDPQDESTPVDIVAPQPVEA